MQRQSPTKRKHSRFYQGRGQNLLHLGRRCWGATTWDRPSPWEAAFRPSQDVVSLAVASAEHSLTPDNGRVGDSECAENITMLQFTGGQWTKTTLKTKRLGHFTNLSGHSRASVTPDQREVSEHNLPTTNSAGRNKGPRFSNFDKC